MEPNKPIVKQSHYKWLLESIQKQIAKSLPQHVKSDDMIRSAILAITYQPRLLECTQISLQQSVLEAAQLGLIFNRTLGQGYLVPYNEKVKLPGGKEIWQMRCHFQTGYRGLMDLARRGGDAFFKPPQVVYDGDEFDYQIGTKPFIHHKPSDENDPSKITHAYAIAYIKGDPDPLFEVMSIKQVMDIRKRSKSGDAGPWKTDFAQMCRKCPIRRLSNYLPMSSERLIRAIEIDDRDTNLEDATPTIEQAGDLPDFTEGDKLANRLNPDQQTEVIDVEIEQDAQTTETEPPQDTDQTSPDETTQTKEPKRIKELTEDKRISYGRFYAIMEQWAIDFMEGQTAFEDCISRIIKNYPGIQSNAEANEKNRRTILLAVEQGRFDWREGKETIQV